MLSVILATLAGSASNPGGAAERAGTPATKPMLAQRAWNQKDTGLWQIEMGARRTLASGTPIRLGAMWFDPKRPTLAAAAKGSGAPALTCPGVSPKWVISSRHSFGVIASRADGVSVSLTPDPKTPGDLTSAASSPAWCDLLPGVLEHFSRFEAGTERDAFPRHSELQVPTSGDSFSISRNYDQGRIYFARYDTAQIAHAAFEKEFRTGTDSRTLQDGFPALQGPGRGCVPAITSVVVEMRNYVVHLQGNEGDEALKEVRQSLASMIPPK